MTARAGSGNDCALNFRCRSGEESALREDEIFERNADGDRIRNAAQDRLSCSS